MQNESGAMKGMHITFPLKAGDLESLFMRMRSRYMYSRFR